MIGRYSRPAHMSIVDPRTCLQQVRVLDAAVHHFKDVYIYTTRKRDWTT